MIAHTTLPSPLGDLLLTDHGAGLSGVYFPGHRAGRGPTPGPGWREDVAPFVVAAAQLDAYLAGDRDVFDLVIDPRGTDFQRQVWTVLRELPYGTTTTYGDVARRIGRPTASRAVAAAVGANPLSLVVPCHRVIGGDGALTGYAGGVERKAWLLAREASSVRTSPASPAAGTAGPPVGG